MRFTLRLVTLALGLGLLAGSIALATSGQIKLFSSAEPPPAESEARTVETVSIPEVGITLEAPDALYKPAVTASQAIETAWKEEGVPGDPTSVRPTLGLLTHEHFAGYVDTPVWAVRFEGACVPVHGPMREEPLPGMRKCASTDWTILIDASTGDFIAAYTA